MVRIVSHVCIFRSQQSHKCSRNFLPFMVQYLFTRAFSCALSNLLNAFHIYLPGGQSVTRSPSALYVCSSSNFVCISHVTCPAHPFLLDLIILRIVFMSKNCDISHYAVLSILMLLFHSEILISSFTPCFQMCTICMLFSSSE
jgi:hypothetical protein